MAEHVPGEPYRYKHGWIPVDAVDKTKDGSGSRLFNRLQSEAAAKQRPTKGRYAYEGGPGWTYDNGTGGQVTAWDPNDKTTTVHSWATKGLQKPRHPDDIPKPLYHGTRREIPNGAQIEPGHSGNFVKSMKHAYMTDDYAEAQHYAGPTGTVYQVKPTGWYGHRADAKGTSWATAGPMNVIAKYPQGQ